MHSITTYPHHTEGAVVKKEPDSGMVTPSEEDIH